jgi:hypothetical protein
MGAGDAERCETPWAPGEGARRVDRRDTPEAGLRAAEGGLRAYARASGGPTPSGVASDYTTSRPPARACPASPRKQ